MASGRSTPRASSSPRPVVIRLLAYVRIPRDAHRRKITRRAVFARDRWTCQYCGHERGNLTVDHVIPRSKGGTSSWDNIVTCCAPCNRRKGDRLPRQANMVPAQQAAWRPAPPSSSTSRPRASLRRGSSTWWPPDGALVPREAAGAGGRFFRPAIRRRPRRRRRAASPVPPAPPTQSYPPPRPPVVPAGRPPVNPPPAPRPTAAGARLRAAADPRPRAGAATAQPPAPGTVTARPAPAAAGPRPPPTGDARPATVAELRSLRRWLVVAGGLGRGGHRDRGARVRHRERRRRPAPGRHQQPGRSIQRRVNRQVDQLETRLERPARRHTVTELQEA